MHSPKTQIIVGLASSSQSPVQPMRVLVVTLNWNTAQETMECVESLLRVDYPSFGVAIVDNASKDGSLVRLRSYLLNRGGTQREEKVLMWKGTPLTAQKYSLLGARGPIDLFLIAADQNYGFPGGNNIGIALGQSLAFDAMLLLNNDTVVDEKFLSELARAMSAEPKVGIAGSKVYYYDFPKIVQTAGGMIRWYSGRFQNYGNRPDLGQFDSQSDRDFVYATSMLVSSQVFQKVGNLDEFFVFGIEEFDFCTRAKDAGFRILYVPSSRVWHKGGRSAAKLASDPETLEQIMRNRGVLGLKYEIVFFRKHLGYPTAVLPVYVRLMYILFGLCRDLVLSLGNREALTKLGSRSGVGKLHLLEVQELFKSLMPRGKKRT
jgi:GT2 family glycosyltransferase